MKLGDAPQQESVGIDLDHLDDINDTSWIRSAFDFELVLLSERTSVGGIKNG